MTDEGHRRGPDIILVTERAFERAGGLDAMLNSWRCPHPGGRPGVSFQSAMSISGLRPGHRKRPFSTHREATCRTEMRLLAALGLRCARLLSRPGGWRRPHFSVRVPSHPLAPCGRDPQKAAVLCPCAFPGGSGHAVGGGSRTAGAAIQGFSLIRSPIPGWSVSPAAPCLRPPSYCRRRTWLAGNGLAICRSPPLRSAPSRHPGAPPGSGARTDPQLPRCCSPASR